MDEINNTAPIVQPVEQIQPIQQPQQSAGDNNISSVPPGKSNKITIILAVVIIIILIAGGAGFFLIKSKSVSQTSAVNSNTAVPSSAQQSPYDSLKAAIDKTVSAKTAYLEYQTKVASSLTNAKTGITQTLHNNVDGTITGSTDGKTSDLVMKIYADATPDQSLNMSVLTAPSGDSYIQTAQTAPKWQKITKEEAKQNSSSPIDASLFGINILSTVFSSNHGLFNALTKDSVTSIGQEDKDNTTYDKYQAEVSIPSYINAISKDPGISSKDISDTKQILQNAIITVVFYVDKNTGYVGRLNIVGKGFMQIPTPESEQLGISTTHDMDLNATLSRFNVPTNITVPSSGEVLGISTGPVIKP